MDRHELYSQFEESLVSIICREFNLKEDDIDLEYLREYFLGYEVEIFYDKKELYKSLKVGENTGYLDLRDLLDNLLEKRLDSGFNTLVDLLMYDIKEELEYYGIDYIAERKDIYVVFHTGTLEYIIKNNIIKDIHFDDLCSDLEKVFEGYELDKSALKINILTNNIKFYKSKLEFINEFDFNKADMLDYILSYYSLDDDFITDTCDIALTYLQESGFIDDIYALHKIENNKHNTYRLNPYVYIPVKIIRD